jgi:hypothetical protein
MGIKERGVLYRVYRREVVDSLRFHFNPEVTSQRYSVNWIFTDGPQQYIPAAVFSGFEFAEQRIAFLVYGRFEDSPQKYINKYKARLQLFTSPGPPFGLQEPGFVSPGRAFLSLGGQTEHGVVTSLDFRDILFDEYGRPTATEVEILFKPVSSGFRQDVARLNTLRTRAGLNG